MRKGHPEGCCVSCKIKYMPMKNNWTIMRAVPITVARNSPVLNFQM